MKRKGELTVTFKTEVFDDIKSQHEATNKIMDIVAQHAPKFNFSSADFYLLRFRRIKRRFH
jgi:hypothetical protein